MVKYHEEVSEVDEVNQEHEHETDHQDQKDKQEIDHQDNNLIKKY